MNDSPDTLTMPVRVEFDRKTGTVLSVETANVPVTEIAEALFRIFGSQTSTGGVK